MTDTSDPTRETIDRAAAGDSVAQRNVLEACYQPARKLLYRLIGPSDDLEDLHQDVLIQVITSLPSYQGSSRFSTWVGGICVNVARHHLRHKRVRAGMLFAGSAARCSTCSPGCGEAERGRSRRS